MYAYIIVECRIIAAVHNNQIRCDIMNGANNTRINHIYSSLINADIILMYDKAFNIGQAHGPGCEGPAGKVVRT